MSGKHFNPLEDPPSASSSDEDDMESSNGEDEANSSPEVDESSRNPPVEKPQTAINVLDSDSEEESDSETERKLLSSVVETKDSAVKIHDSEEKGKSSEKFDSVVVKDHDSENGKSSETKRARETDGGGGASSDAKKVKRVSEEETKKHPPLRRLWSEDDEILVLQGVISYRTDTGVSPLVDMDGFYQLVKKSIRFNATKLQVKEKLRSLKKKYMNNLGRLKKGEESTFCLAHDRKVFDLSKVIWGADGKALDSAVKPNDKSEKKLKSKRVESVKQEHVSSLPNGKNHEDEVTDNNKGEASSHGITDSEDTFLKSFLVKSLARYGVDDLAAQHGWSRLASEDKKRFEEQWKTLQLKEFEFYSQKSGFIHDVLKKMAEAFRSSP